MDDLLPLLGIFLFFSCTCYIPPTVIVYKNLQFKEPFKSLFSFTVVPFFIFLMFKNIVFTLDYMPKVIDYLMHEQEVGRGAFKGNAFIGLLASCPLPVFATFVYYKTFSLVNKKVYGN